MKRVPVGLKALIGAIAVGVLFVLSTTAFASHSWNDYHWAGDGTTVSPTVVDDTSSSLYDVTAGVDEWAGLGTRIQPTITTASKGNITVKEAFSPFWYGLARIFVEDGHITKGEVKLNTRLLASKGEDAADHVLCQELGHVLGLGHNRDSLTTCMNDTATLGSATSPNTHDTQQLTSIYGHLDAAAPTTDDGGGGGGGGPPCDKKPDHPKCQSSNGVWITVHVFWVE